MCTLMFQHTRRAIGRLFFEWWDCGGEFSLLRFSIHRKVGLFLSTLNRQSGQKEVYSCYMERHAVDDYYSSFISCVLHTQNCNPTFATPRRSFFKIGTKHFLEGFIVNISKYLPGAYFMPGI